MGLEDHKFHGRSLDSKLQRMEILAGKLLEIASKLFEVEVKLLKEKNIEKCKQEISLLISQEMELHQGWASTHDKELNKKVMNLFDIVIYELDACIYLQNRFFLGNSVNEEDEGNRIAVFFMKITDRKKDIAKRIDELQNHHI